MTRKHFLKSTSKFLVASTLGLSNFGNLQSLLAAKDLVVGHNSHRYKVDLQWGALDPKKFPIKDCHEMVQDSKGRILLLTNHTQNNVLIYNKDGDVVNAWGTDFPGAHGLTLMDEGGEDMLYITDTIRQEVIKTTLEGKIVFRLPHVYTNGFTKDNSYQPTETAIADNGDIYVADGYGEQYILHYNSKGELLNVFGGKGNAEDKFNNAHGICIDNRTETPTLLITARMQNKLKRFSLEGEWIENIDLPGAFICRPVIKGENVYLATIWSNDGGANTGFVTILDKNNRVISALGGNSPQYELEGLVPMYQTLQLFKHPHDVCVDEEENLYVAQWNAGQVYPFRLERI